MKLKQFIQQETVLTAAAVLAVVSAFFVPPDAQYLGYIDLRTLAILFSLMTVMAGLRRQPLIYPLLLQAESSRVIRCARTVGIGIHAFHVFLYNPADHGS